ncbi:nitrilase-related carbon-nitrogen hydrolase [Streptomyces sp. 5-6(2022)]|uniref:nitrilase-related carbon-nitrogen hydrolase n=1 Tax=Streptomyces sp. 5-6(2022) TaxID=2936510 RepID=UPI0023B95F59|nr:nitrilase-related carbon-nitrogen hydrolase [Streptomyces sp. 5-6(2022)]
MSEHLSVACVQLTPDADRAAGIAAAVAAVRQAAAEGVELVALPEYVVQLHSSGRVMREGAGPEEGDEALAAFSAAAREGGCWVLVGSLTQRTADGRVANRSFLIDDSGSVVARYDKLHMFEATMPNGRVIRESKVYEPGSHAVVADTPWGGLGMSICYDVRFPQLYRALAQHGAGIITVPSAFTQSTGELHWHALLRARAIENGCFIVAPATCGVHPESHATFGHSLVVDPFGAVVLDGGVEPGVYSVDLHLSQLGAARSKIPSLEHDRPFTVEVPSRLMS